MTYLTKAAGGACTSLHGGGPKKRGLKGLSHRDSFSYPILGHHIKYHISLPLGRVRSVLGQFPQETDSLMQFWL